MRRILDLRHPALPAAIMACLGLVMALILLSFHGPGLSTDAVNYLSTAEHVAAGRGFTNFEGDFYVLWPPLYPVLLAIPRMLFDRDPLLFGAALNAVAFGGVIFLMGILAGRLLGSHGLLSNLAAAAALLSTGTFAVALNIGSDPLFIVLMLGFFLLFERYERLDDRASMTGLTVVAALACLQRYVGATLILAGFIGILYARRTEIRRGWIQAAAFAGLSSLPLAVWIFRNYSVNQTLLGVRDPSTWRPDENLRDIAAKASRWFVPYQLGSRPIFWIALGVLLLVVVIAYSHQRGESIRFGAPRPVVFVLMAFSIIYLAAMIVLTKSVDHKNIPYDDRLYLPAFFSLMLVFLYFIQHRLAPLLRGWNQRLGQITLAGAALLWLVFPANGVYKFWVRSINDGGIAYYNIYNMPTFRDSAVTQHLTPWATDPTTTVFSNYPAAVYLFTRRTVGSLPGRTDFFGVATPLAGYVGVWPGPSPSVLVWYEPNLKRNLYNVRELAELASFRPVFASDDGSIYQIEAR